MKSPHSQMKSDKIKWLQISDLHFGDKDDYSRKSREALKKHIVDKKEEIDYIFITGDIIYAKDATDDAKVEAYKAAGEYIKEIYRMIWGTDVTDTENAGLCRRIFIVPGNHDLNRDPALESNAKGIIKYYDTNGNRDIDKSFLNHVNTSLKEFHSFYERITNRDFWGLARDKFHYVIETGNLNILHINTCITSCSNEDSGSLLIGYGLISRALDDLNDQNPTIAIAHHGFDELARGEREKLEILLKKHNVALYLCGHSHMRQSEIIMKSNQVKRLHSFTCGTLMSPDGQNRSADTVVFHGELDLKLRSGRVYSFKWDLASEWHEDMDFGRVQEINNNFRNFSSDSIDPVGSINLPAEECAGQEGSDTPGVCSQIVSHCSTERTMAFCDLNRKARESLSIYGVGISSVSKNKELLDRILETGGVVRLCMVDPKVFKKENCSNLCDISDTNFCVYSEHMDQYIRAEYYDDICKSYERVIKYRKIATENGWNLQVRILRSFIPMSINIIDEDLENAELIVEHNMPFTNKRLLIRIDNRGDNLRYFRELHDVFHVIWERAVEISEDDN